MTDLLNPDALHHELVLDHHPDVAISWNRVTLTLVTHSAGGVTQSDVELARRLDPLAIDEPPAT